MNNEFTVHILNEAGINRARQLAEHFDDFLEVLKIIVPEGRYLSIVRTKLEEASFFAKKGMAEAKEYQK